MIAPLVALVIVTVLVPVAIKASPCLQRPDPGLCKAYIPRYFFNATTGSCERFIWGGCLGSVPFETVQECRSAQCIANARINISPDGIPQSSISSCRQLPNAGPCRAFIPRYFYNQTSNACQGFVWGGCRGLVPFETMRECEQTCDDSDDGSGRDACSSIPDPGPCNASIRKYFFNRETNRCERFVWGGCDGNVPFDTRQECKAAQCEGDVALFTQEPDAEASEEAEVEMLW